MPDTSESDWTAQFTCVTPLIVSRRLGDDCGPFTGTMSIVGKVLGFFGGSTAK
jgi:hypothetical protein